MNKKVFFLIVGFVGLLSTVGMLTTRAENPTPFDTPSDAPGTKVRFLPRTVAQETSPSPPVLEPATGPSDPTMPGKEIREILERENAKKQLPSVAPSVARPAPLPEIPEIRLKGRIMMRDKPPVAIVEIAGKNIAIQEGMQLTVPGKHNAAEVLQLKVTRLSGLEVRLECVNRKEVISLN